MTKTRLAKGIWTHPRGGRDAVVEVAGTQTWRHFPDGTSIETMQAWQAGKRRQLETQPAPLEGALPRAARGTLEEDVARYLAQIVGRVSYKAERSHLRAWLPQIGHLAREAVTTEDINLAIAAWRRGPGPKAVRRIAVAATTRGAQTIKAYDRTTPATSGQVVATRTIRHRCRVLADLYHTLDGSKHSRTPVDDAKVPPLDQTFPMGVEVATIYRVAEALAAAGAPQTYARYVVLVATGQRPAQLMRAVPGDWDLELGYWRVRSAKGAPAHTIALTQDMVDALRTFEAADAWGPYDETQHARRVHAAGWPALVRPYNARHALMIDALAKGIDLGDVQGLAGHTSPATTRKFYGPIAMARQRQVAAKLEGRLAGLFGPRLVKPSPQESTKESTKDESGRE